MARESADGRTGGDVSSSDSRRGLWLAVATTALAAAIDLIYGVEASLIVPLVFGPFVASALASVRDTVAVALIAVVLGVLLGLTDDTIGTSPHLVRVASVAIGSGLAMWLAVERLAREAKLRSVSHVAEVAQQAILHPLPEEIRGVRLAARYLSASADARVGGDFYEALDTPWGLRLVVGDVRGKGLGAVQLASVLLGEFRSRALSEPDLTSVARLVDAAGCRFGDDSGEDFATAVFVQLDGEVATVVRSGHPFPLLANGQGVIPMVVSPSLPLCLGTEGISEEVRVSAGARLLCYSDGALEGRDGDGAHFDLASSFARHVGAPDLATVLDNVVADLATHCEGGIDDDVVLVLAEQPTGQSPVADRPSLTVADITR